MLKNKVKFFVNLPKVSSLKCQFPISQSYHDVKQRTKHWEEENVQNFLEKVKNQLNLQTTKDWINLTSKQIQENGGSRLLKLYSINELKKLGNPKISENSLKEIKKKGYWNDEENVIKFIKNLGEKLNLKTPEDWENNLTNKLIIQHKGSRILTKYSIYDLKSFGCLTYSQKYPNKSYKPKKYWENEENIKNFIDQLKKHKNIKTNDDWNKLTQRDIQKFGGSGLLSKYSIFEIKQFENEEKENRIIKKTNKKPHGYWKNKENIIQFLHEIGNKKKLNSMEDWISFPVSEFIKLGGQSILSNYTFFELKCLLYPKIKEISPEIQKKNKNPGFWDKKENLQNLIHEISEKLNLKTPEDWEQISSAKIREFGGGRAIAKYSLSTLKSMAFPDYHFIKRKKYISKGHWNDFDNVLQFLNKLQLKYNLNTLDDWNKLSAIQVRNLPGGSSLLAKYSLIDLKYFKFPNDKNFFNKRAEYRTLGYWDDKDNIFKFIQLIKEKFQYFTSDDWIQLSVHQVKSIPGGSSFLSKYTLYQLKCFAFPDDSDLFYCRIQKPKGFWKKKENIIELMEYVKKINNIQCTSDWNRVSRKQIQDLGGGCLLSKYSLYDLLSLTFPDEKFDKNALVRKDKRAVQRWLFLQLKQLFTDNIEIIEDYFHGDLTRISGFPVQFDIFIPSKNIAIEYHGEHHFRDIPSGFGHFEMYASRDNEKIKLCSDYNIKLIAIPHTWDNNVDSLRKYLEDAKVIP